LRLVVSLGDAWLRQTDRMAIGNRKTGFMFEMGDDPPVMTPP
jgi:hypothetical protein